MDPSYQPPAQQNPYDFLNNQPSNQRRQLFTSNNPKQKMLVSILFVAGVIFLLVVVLVVFRSLTKKDYSVYNTMLKKQTEIIRLANTGSTKARDSSVKNYTATIYQVTTSEKTSTLAFVKKNGVKVNEKALDAAKDANNDKALTAAESANQYDQKLSELLNSLIISYQKDIQASAQKVSTKSEKTLVTTLQNNAKIIANAPTK